MSVKKTHFLSWSLSDSSSYTPTQLMYFIFSMLRVDEKFVLLLICHLYYTVCDFLLIATRSTFSSVFSLFLSSPCHWHGLLHRVERRVGSPSVVARWWQGGIQLRTQFPKKGTKVSAWKEILYKRGVWQIRLQVYTLVVFEDLRALQKYVGKENVPIPAHLGDIPGNNASVSPHYKQLFCILMHSAGHLLVFLISAH